MASIQPAAFPSYTRRDIRLQNLLVTRRPQLRMDVNGEPLVLLLGSGLAPALKTPSIGLAGGEARLWISIAEALFRRLCMPWLGNQSSGGSPSAAAECRIERCFRSSTVKAFTARFWDRHGVG